MLFLYKATFKNQELEELKNLSAEFITIKN